MNLEEEKSLDPGTRNAWEALKAFYMEEIANVDVSWLQNEIELYMSNTKELYDLIHNTNTDARNIAIQALVYALNGRSDKELSLEDCLKAIQYESLDLDEVISKPIEYVNELREDDKEFENSDVKTESAINSNDYQGNDQSIIEAVDKVRRDNLRDGIVSEEEFILQCYDAYRDIENTLDLSSAEKQNIKSYAQQVYKKLNESKNLIESTQLDNDLLNYMWDNMDYNARAEVTYIPTYDDVTYNYDDTIDEGVYSKAYNYINNLIKSIKFYNSDGTILLELSDRRTLNNITNPDIDYAYYSEVVSDYLNQFEQQTGVDIYIAGRMGRHICVDNSLENAKKYKELQQIQTSLEDKMIKFLNTKEVNESLFSASDEVIEDSKEKGLYTESEDEQVPIINPDDKDFYNKLYKIFLYSGVGVSGVTYKVYADYEEQALEIAVAYAEDNAPGVLTDIAEVSDDEEPMYIYVDATEYGASQPYYISIESSLEELDNTLTESEEYKGMNKKLRDFANKYDIDPDDLDEVLYTIDDVEGMFGDQTGELQQLREYIYNELLTESKEETEDIVTTLQKRKNAIIRLMTKYSDLGDVEKVSELEQKLKDVEIDIENYSNPDKPMIMHESKGSDILWDNINSYSDEEINKIRNILQNLNVEAVDNRGYSVAIKIKSNGMIFWIDYIEEDGDVVGNWNQYIFNTDNEEDRIRQAVQTSYLSSDNTPIAFEEMESEGFNYLQEKGLLTESINVDGFENDAELQQYFQKLHTLPDEITIDGKEYKMDMYGDTQGMNYVIYTDVDNDDSYIKVFYTMNEVDPGHFKGINKITGVSDLREGKQITKSIESKTVRMTSTVDSIILQLRQLGMSEEQAEQTVKAIVNIFKSRSPQIVEESKEDEDILDNLSTQTIDKVSKIIYNMIQKGWDGDINKVKQYYEKVVEENKKLEEDEETDDTGMGIDDQVAKDLSLNKTSDIYSNEDDEQEEKTTFDLLQDRIGEDLNIGEFNTVMQSIFGKYGQTFLLTVDVQNMEPNESEEVVINDDGDIYVITYVLKDLSSLTIEITDVFME